jgi:organic hydroperoxide reductase OsmC/OhrA
MSEHKVLVEWSGDREDFSYQTYTRNHSWSFEGGSRVEASAAPGFLGDESRVDPEEALVASLSSCHMLTFLAVAAKKRYVVDSYTDDAVGFMEKNTEGKLAITRVVLRPRIVFSGERQPTTEQVDELHHIAHAECFIANSVKAEIVVEPTV